MYRPGYDGGWADHPDNRVKKNNGVRPGWKSKAGITRHVRFYDLRHTAPSHLVMGTWGRRWSLREVQELMGHHSVRVTERYAHLAEGALAADAKATPGCPTVAPDTAAKETETDAKLPESFWRTLEDSNL